MGLLSLLLIIPAAGAAIIALAGRQAARARVFALAVSLVTFLLSLAVWNRFDASRADCQMVESISWIPSLGATFLLGVDGISLFLVLLTTFILPLMILAAREPLEEKAPTYFANLLLLEAVVVGYFLALDVFLLYVFWTAMLVPVALLLEVWGAEPRGGAAIKFFVHSMAGNLLVLAVILICYHFHTIQSGIPSFDLRLWEGLVLDPVTQDRLFLALFVGFALQMVLFPFYRWHTDALAQAPMVAGVILAAVFLKGAAFGLLRIAVPLFPQAARSHGTFIVTLAVVSILVGSVAALVERDMKRVLAFINMTHMGLVTLGVFSFRAAGVEGALYLMISHGTFMAAFLIMVHLLSERWRTDRVGELGGLLRVMPIGGALFLLVALASVGVPGLNGFTGIARILSGWLESAPHLAGLAGFGMLVSAVSILKLFAATMLGPLTRGAPRGKLDLGRRELVVLMPLVLMILWMGFSPQSFLGFMERSVEVFVSRATQGAVLPE